ncbi:MAG: hypothetical protein Q8P90_03970 [bacterium]|nr:hypothetical protein [bacterium]
MTPQLVILFVLCVISGITSILTFGWATPFAPLCAGIFLSAIMSGWFGRQHEGVMVGNGNVPWPWTNSVVAIGVFFLHYIPIAWGWWEYPGWFAWCVIGALACAAIFILYPSRRTPPGAYFWGFLTALGGIMLRWGLYYMQDWMTTHSGSTSSAGLAFIMTATTIGIVGSLVLLITMAVRLSEKNVIFFRLPGPGMLKYILSGSTMVGAVADLTGVPLSPVPVPADRQGDLTATWRWMLGNLRRRGDPRAFLTNHVWVGPAFFYPGIPFFTVVGNLIHAILPRLGTEYATLQQMPDRDFKKGPFSTGQGGPELEVTVGFNMRLINPFVLWGQENWNESLDHLMDVFTADLVSVIGDRLYGVHGSLIGRNLPNGGRVPGIAVEGIPARAQTRIHFGNEAIDPIQVVAFLVAAFERGVAETIGMMVTSVRVKDVDVSALVRGINDEMVKTWAERSLAEAKAETIRLTAGAQVQALMDAAEHHGVPEADRGKILMEAAKFYFLSGDADGAILGVLANTRTGSR